MGQGKSAYKTLLRKGHRIDSYGSIIDLRIGKGVRFENTLKSGRDLR